MNWIKTRGARLTISILGSLLLAPALAYGVFTLSFIWLVKNKPDGPGAWDPAIFGGLTWIVGLVICPFGLFYLQKRFIP